MITTAPRPSATVAVELSATTSARCAHAAPGTWHRAHLITPGPDRIHVAVCLVHLHLVDPEETP
ncbi:hypothetical protein [Streptacidiphilus cavernicola]|uniref:Uncharacterized protein n=1 Tax=Streptacidiphilus cavernicola TaxID=3342716 RepID=A0ABV6VY35_9ACTN